LEIVFFSILSVVQKNPNCSKSITIHELSNILDTTFSPNFTGRVETLTSNFFHSIVNEYFQSWGILVMFNLSNEAYLSLSKINLYSLGSSLKISTNIQSILNLT
jgi:hypothetical protein